MAVTREDWKLLGKILLSTQGPAYADRLRALAFETEDARERARLLARARIVERGAASPDETIDDLEALHDLIFGKPRRTNGRSRKR